MDCADADIELGLPNESELANSSSDFEKFRAAKRLEVRL